MARPTVLIIESHREVAAALEDVVNSTRYVGVVRPYVERLSDVGFAPAAIIVRVVFEGVGEPTHLSVERLGPNRPPVVAIAWEDAAVVEAERLKCDVVLHAPREIARLADVLDRLVTRR